MKDLVFPVYINGGDADVEISVSDRDAKLLARYASEDCYDSPEDVEELEPIIERLRRKVYAGLCNQVEEYEEMDIDDLDFTFGFPDACL